MEYGRAKSSNRRARVTNVRALIDAVIRIDSSADAIEWEGRWLDWGDLSERVDTLRALYAEMQLPTGARIGVMLRNRLPQLCALYSVLIADACLVTVNPLYPDIAVSDDLRTLALPLVIAEQADLDRPGVMEALAETGTAIIALPESWSGTARILRSRTPMATQREASADVIIEMLTSGTTGKPKRVALTRNAFQHSFDSALRYEANRDGEIVPQLRSGVQILIAPLTHIGGVWGAINGIASGRRTVLLEKFRVEPWRQAVAKYRPIVAGATSAGLRMILDAEVPKEDLASLRVLTAGAAPVEPDVIDAFWERYGIPVLANYGATEFAGPVAGWSLPDFKAHYADKRGAAGRLHRDVEGRVVNPETDAILPPMTEGVLELKSPQLPDPDNWLRTTDKAKIDTDNFLWITGRADSAIIRGGFKVQPDDVVRALESHPAIREAVVVAIPDARLGQVPGAAIILRARAKTPTEADLIAYLRDRLLPYQVPVVFRIVDDVPRSASLKPILPDVAALLVALAKRPNQ
jgi:long-chain acyl-CoA synthetase